MDLCVIGATLGVFRTTFFFSGSKSLASRRPKDSVPLCSRLQAQKPVMLQVLQNMFFSGCCSARDPTQYGLVWHGRRRCQMRQRQKSLRRPGQE